MKRPTFEIFDKFNKDTIQDNWIYQHRKWGVDNGGVIKENVRFSEDGYLLLYANGNKYEGDLVGIDQPHGKKTGSAIRSKLSFGPGSFEVRAKILPKFGATSAFWTFHYSKNHDNHEIDIELNVENDFHSVWFTNWLTLEKKDHHSIKTIFPHNDGKFHKYRFDWHLDVKPRIEYYIDDILYFVSTTHIPFFEMPFTIGVWFPKDWAGEPDFETEFMKVDYFKYQPFINEDCLENDGID